MPVDTPRIFRRVSLGIYLTYTFGACVWVTASIVAALVRERPVRLKRPAIDPAQPAQVLRCEHDVNNLVQDLHRHVFAVQMGALDKETDLRREWFRFLETWRDRWAEVGRRCRLGESAGSGSGRRALELLTEAHEQIEELATAYGALLETFENRYLDRLHDIRKTLADARTTARRTQGKEELTK
ncbi:MAG: hypothetical protein AABZ30_13405 [Myxococcota bacterium]